MRRLLRRLGAGMWVLAAVLAAPAMAAEQVLERGEFRFSVGPEPEFVQVASVPESWPDDSSAAADEPWRNWLIDRQIDRRQGRHVSFEDRAYQPLAANLVGDAARFSIDFSPAFQKLTIHRVELRRDGAWLNRLVPEKISLARRESGFEDNMADGQVTALIVLDDVRPGDIVRVSYTVDGSNPIMAGNISNGFLLAWSRPMLVRSGRVLFDPGTPVAVTVHGAELTEERTDHADRREVSFLVRDTPGERDAGRYPNWFSPYPYVEIGAERRWADIVAWALPLYPDTAELPAELETRLKQWQAIDDPYRRAAAVLRATQEEVRYFGVEMGDNTHQPHTPAVTWERRYGDCKDKALLTVVLLRRLGFDAEPALVSTTDGRAVKQQQPAASAFNHVIVRLRLDGKSFWLDPTLTQQRGDLRKLDLFDYGAALPILAGNDALVDVEAPSGIDNGLVVKETYAPSADGKTVDLRVEARYRGSRAEAIRHRLQSRRLDQLSEDFADYYGKQYGALTVVSPATIEHEDESNLVVLREHYRLTEALESSGDSVWIDVFAEALSDDLALPSSMTRSEPLALSRPGQLRQEVRVELPEGWVLRTVPGDLGAKAGPLVYQRTLAMDKGAAAPDKRTVALDYRLVTDEDHVTAGDMPAFLEALRTARESLNLRLVFGLPTKVQSSDRDRRLRELMRGAIPAPSQDKD